MKDVTGTVYLVGAGPGDPGLITVRGMELLSRADFVVYDALVSTDLLPSVPETAEIVYGGKRSSDHALSQDQLNGLLIQKAREGKRVVRLKGGDPYIFGRGGEEAERLAEAGIPFEIIPGISSASAAPAYAGIPLTHRQYCSAMTVITGHEDPTKSESAVDWSHWAGTGGTLVILMGVERIRAIAEALMSHGMRPETPVGAVQWGTTGRQRSTQATLATIADELSEKGFQAPVVTVIGEVVSLRAKLNWFEQRPLFGRRIVVTRTRKQAGKLSSRLRDLGAEVLEIPTIKIAPPSQGEDLKDAMLELHAYEWIVFTSPNGVEMFFHFFFKLFDDIRHFGGMRIAAIGPATAAKVREYHLEVDLMPEKYTSTEIVDALAAEQSIENTQIVLMRAEKANRELPQSLEKLGAIVDDVACYRTEPETADPTGAAARFQEEGADWITFTSSSTVENFHARFDLPRVMQNYPRTGLASIGPETSKTLRALGLEPTLEAPTHTIDGLVEALLGFGTETGPASPSLTDESVGI